MKPLTIVGIVLIALGVVALVYQGFTYTTKEKVLELGPLKAEVEREKQAGRSGGSGELLAPNHRTPD